MLRAAVITSILFAGFIAGCARPQDSKETGSTTPATKPTAHATKPAAPVSPVAKSTPAAETKPIEPANSTPVAGAPATAKEPAAATTAADAALDDPSRVDSSPASTPDAKIDEKDAPKADSLPDKDVREKLEEAARLLARGIGNDDSKFNQIMQSVADNFQEVKASTRSAQAPWQTVTLFKDGRTLDAVRFRSTLEGPADLFWIYVREQIEMSWYILPREGKMTGFRNYEMRRNVDFYDNPTIAANVGVFQPLRQGMIQPGKEYILWFWSTERRPSTLDLAIFLGPQGTGEHAYRPEEISMLLGKELMGRSVPREGFDLTKQVGNSGWSAFSPDGKMAATGGTSGTVKLLYPDRFDLIEEFRIGPYYAGRLTFSPDSKLLAVARYLDWEGAGVDLWNVETRQMFQQIPDELSRKKPNQQKWVPETKFSADGSRLYVLYFAYSDADDMLLDLVAWDIAEKKMAGRIEIDRRGSPGFALLPDDKIAILTYAASQRRNSDTGATPVDRTSFLSIYDAKTLKQIDEQRLPQKGINCFAVSPDGQKMITGTADEIALWDFPKRTIEFIALQGSAVQSCEFSVDGKQFAFGRADGSVRVWDTAGKKPVAMWHAHEKSTGFVRFSPDGKFVASASTDGGRVRSVVPDANELAKRTTTNSIGMTLHRLPAGRVVMGSDPGGEGVQPDELPAHRVEISNPFYVAAHEVTVGQFRQFVAATKYVTDAEKDNAGGQVYSPECKWEKRPETNWQKPGFDQDDKHPVVQVSWTDAEAFCKWLSEKEKMTYRLPTEAEWEYACRAGSVGAFSNSDDETAMDSAWEVMNGADLSMHKVLGACKAYESWDDKFAYTAPVGSFEANSAGLYDTHGNVAEWCSDWHGPYQSEKLSKDPKGPIGGVKRVIRGGSFVTDRYQSRSSSRGSEAPSDRFFSVGFRVVRER